MSKVCTNIGIVSLCTYHWLWAMVSYTANTTSVKLLPLSLIFYCTSWIEGLICSFLEITISIVSEIPLMYFKVLNWNLLKRHALAFSILYWFQTLTLTLPCDTFSRITINSWLFIGLLLPFLFCILLLVKTSSQEDVWLISFYSKQNSTGMIWDFSRKSLETDWFFNLSDIKNDNSTYL